MRPDCTILPFTPHAKKTLIAFAETFCCDLSKFEFLIRHANVQNTVPATMRCFSRIAMGSGS